MCVVTRVAPIPDGDSHNARGPRIGLDRQNVEARLVLTVVKETDDLTSTLRELRRAITDEFIAKLPRELSVGDAARLFGVSQPEFEEWVRLGAVVLESDRDGGLVMCPGSNRALFDEPRVLRWGQKHATAFASS